MPPIAAVREGATLPESTFFDRILRAAPWYLLGAIAAFVLAALAPWSFVGGTFGVFSVLGLILAYVALAHVVGSRTVMVLLVIVVGFALLVAALFLPDLETKTVLGLIGIGAILIFLGVALFSARIVRPMTALVSPIGTWAVVAALGDLLAVLDAAVLAAPRRRLRTRRRLPAGESCSGCSGSCSTRSSRLIVLVMWVRRKLTRWEPEWPLDFPGVLPDRTMNRIATHNARRNPQRTASTAAALMIGLALVTLVATLAAGITSTFRGAVDDLFASDYAITAQNNFSPIPIAAAEAAAKAPGVEAIASTRTGEARIFDKTEFVTAVDSEAGQGADARLEGRLAGGTRVARRERRLRRRRLREGSQPARRLADHDSGPRRARSSTSR